MTRIYSRQRSSEDGTFVLVDKGHYHRKQGYLRYVERNMYTLQTTDIILCVYIKQGREGLKSLKLL